MEFSAPLLTHGFIQFKLNYYLITRGSGRSFVALLVYVDNILLIESSVKHIKFVKDLLKFHFLLKNLGSDKYFIGLEISNNKVGLSFKYFRIHNF